MTDARFGSTRILRHTNRFAEIWLASEDDQEAAYHYGGTRLVPHTAKDEEVVNILLELTEYESGLKNRLVNWAIRTGAVRQYTV